MRIQIPDLKKTCGLLFFLWFVTQPLYAQPLIVGRVSFARGSNAAQQPGTAPRILGEGAEIYQSDNIQTTERSFVIINFSDGAKITVRPNSSFTVDHYDNQSASPKAQLSLYEGGIRASSGEIAQKNPENFQVKAGAVIVKAQQADYSLRVCNQDCAEEKPATQAAPVKTDQSVVARIVDIKGEVSAKNAADKNAKERLLSLGGPLYSEDTLRSQKDSYALMIFRDGEKITLQADSEMAVAQYHYQHNGKKDQALYRLTTGGMRALTGSIGKTNREAYSIDTPVATIGIRGTGFDLSCVGDCVAESQDMSDLKAKSEKARTQKIQQGQIEGLYSHVWQGQIALTNESGEYLLSVPDSNYIAAQMAAPQGFSELPGILQNIPVPRPDKNNTNVQQLFAAKANQGTPSGSYVTVHKGHVRLDKGDGKGSIDLGKDEVGYVNSKGDTVRLTSQQAFQSQDAYPLPGESDSDQVYNAIYSPLKDDYDASGKDGYQCVSK